MRLTRVLVCVFAVLASLVLGAALPETSLLAQVDSGGTLAPAVSEAPEVPVTSEISEIPEVPTQTSWMDHADQAMGSVNAVLAGFFFWDVMFWDDPGTGKEMPFIVLWLVVAAVFLTFRMGFINFRAFKHAIKVTQGKYTDPSEPGDVSHFQALTTALSATVGLGNIAGVAIAVSIGGPGATFWMIAAGLFGMTVKFTECTLSLMYRDTDRDGRNVLGGPVKYLSKGFSERGMKKLGKVLAVLFALLCIGGSLGGGNSFQVNQSMNAVQQSIPALANMPWLYGLIMTFLVGIVILGGIRRIANVADKIVPLMAAVYVMGCLIVIAVNFTHIPDAFLAIVQQAFAPDAVYGGFIGVLVVGFQRAAFSNEAGAGSAAIAHSAARTKEPVREGIVALLEPFIDTVIICTMTALVIGITGAYNNPEYAGIIADRQGAALTSQAFGEIIPWFPHVLSLSVFLFAYSTMISWSYYGERCSVWLFGPKSSKYYKVLFLVFVFLGSIITSTNILDFGDLMILGMTFPNLIGVYLLQGKVKAALADYWARYKAGEFVVYGKGGSQVGDSRPSLGRNES